MLGDPVFEDMLAERWMRVENAVSEANLLTETVEEAIRLIKEGPSWIPALQNDISIDSQVLITILF